MTDEIGLKAMFDAIPADIGIPKDVMDKARVALAYAQTQASEGDTETAIAIIGKAIMAEREAHENWCEMMREAVDEGRQWGDRYRRRSIAMHRRAQKAEGKLMRMEAAHADACEYAFRSYIDYAMYGSLLLIMNQSLFPKLMPAAIRREAQ